jgi:lysophospholipase L1-like esterase
MRRFPLLGLLIVMVVCASTPARAAQATQYYLALGDSLAQGVQPSAKGDLETEQGYADDLFAVLRFVKPHLALEKLGCPGETSGSMISGGICTYEQGSQLKAALAFLATHQVDLITIDIGANDVDGCVNVSTLSLDPACVENGIETAGSNLAYILGALRQAAGKGTRIVGMNYYDPFLAAYSTGATGQAVAAESLTAANTFNELLGSVYRAFGVPVADVAKEFHTNDTSVLSVVDLPANVFFVDTWTWMAAPPPLGPDIHANAAGYVVIAVAFGKALEL